MPEWVSWTLWVSKLEFPHFPYMTKRGIWMVLFQSIYRVWSIYVYILCIPIALFQSIYPVWSIYILCILNPWLILGVMPKILFVCEAWFSNSLFKNIIIKLKYCTGRYNRFFQKPILSIVKFGARIQN